MPCARRVVARGESRVTKSTSSRSAKPGETASCCFATHGAVALLDAVRAHDVQDAHADVVPASTVGAAGRTRQRSGGKRGGCACGAGACLARVRLPPNDWLTCTTPPPSAADRWERPRLPPFTLVPLPNKGIKRAHDRCALPCRPPPPLPKESASPVASAAWQAGHGHARKHAALPVLAAPGLGRHALRQALLHVRDVLALVVAAGWSTSTRGRHRSHRLEEGRRFWTCPKTP